MGRRLVGPPLPDPILPLAVLVPQNRFDDTREPNRRGIEFPEMRSYEPIDLTRKPGLHKRDSRVDRILVGPGRTVTREEAIALAEKAMSNRAPHTMKVFALHEDSYGWALGLQCERWVETRNIEEMVIGHGVTFVDRDTGDVYGSGSGSWAWDALDSFMLERAKRKAKREP